jgi:hypothetical protein
MPFSPIGCGFAQTAFNQLYMLNRPGQVSARNFITSRFPILKEFVRFSRLD